jgi:preprotein translocase subunit SecD
VGGSDFRSADPARELRTPGSARSAFTLTNEAGDKFYDYTSKNVGKSMAVVMGGRVREVANIKSAIRDQGEIEGSFHQDEVMALSKLLRTGALPASLNYSRTAPWAHRWARIPSARALRRPLSACWWSWPSCSFYYRGSGINADLALFLNLVILLGFMGFRDFRRGGTLTLTLPGIAGVILTIGMGVDSNVLIFERIREEVAPARRLRRRWIRALRMPG